MVNIESLLKHPVNFTVTHFPETVVQYALEQGELHNMFHYLNEIVAHIVKKTYF